MSYVVMSGYSSPIFFVIPTPVAVRKTRKEANAFIKTKKYPQNYYIRYVKDDK